MHHYTDVEEILGGHEILGQRIESSMDILELGKSGIPKSALSNMIKYFSLTWHQLAEILPVTERTLQRYSPDDSFNAIVSEQVLHIAELMARGTEVFNDKSKFLIWLNTPNKALAGKTPFSMLGSRFGINMIMDEIGRIEHGVYS